MAWRRMSWILTRPLPAPRIFDLIQTRTCLSFACVGEATVRHLSGTQICNNVCWTLNFAPSSLHTLRRCSAPITYHTQEWTWCLLLQANYETVCQSAGRQKYNDAFTGRHYLWAGPEIFCIRPHPTPPHPCQGINTPSSRTQYTEEEMRFVHFDFCVCRQRDCTWTRWRAAVWRCRKPWTKAGCWWTSCPRRRSAKSRSRTDSSPSGSPRKPGPTPSPVRLLFLKGAEGGEEGRGGRRYWSVCRGTEG